jgi:hypothetical protein
MHPIQHAHGPLPPLEGTHTHGVSWPMESHSLGLGAGQRCQRQPQQPLRGADPLGKAAQLEHTGEALGCPLLSSGNTRCGESRPHPSVGLAGLEQGVWMQL